MTDKVLVESSLVILTSTEFQNFLQQHRLVAKTISGEGGTWRPGAAHIVNTDAQEIASAKIDFNQPVSLAKFKTAVDASPFRYSLYHYRRPGQPIGTTIAYNEATDRATAVAKQQAAQQQAAQQQATSQKRKQYAPYQISAEEFTGMPLSENPPEVPYEIQQTDEGLFYVDLMKRGQGGYTYLRVEGANPKKLDVFVKQIVAKIIGRQL